MKSKFQQRTVSAEMFSVLVEPLSMAEIYAQRGDLNAVVMVDLVYLIGNDDLADKEGELLRRFSALITGDDSLLENISYQLVGAVKPGGVEGIFSQPKQALFAVYGTVDMSNMPVPEEFREKYSW